VELPGADHLMWAGDQEAILGEVEAFLEEVVPAGDPPPPPVTELGLTEREIEVLRLIAAGRTNKEIASTLYISPKTAGAHVSSILAKLGVERRAAAATLAQRLGLDSP
jgi:DNA-binding NarL/FixJ family response regulator